MKQCPLCRRVYEPEESFCLEDGTLLTDAHAPARARSSHPSTSSVTKKGNSLALMVVGIVAGAALVIIVLIVAKRIYSTDETQEQQTSSTELLPRTTTPPEPEPTRQQDVSHQQDVSNPPTPTPRPTSSTPTPPSPTPAPTPPPSYTPRTPRNTVPLTEENIELGTDRHRFFDFSTRPNGGRVVGQFAARGGVANDMRVLILTPKEYQNFVAQYPFGAEYDSGKITSGSMDVSLPSGDYRLVIMNPSIWTPRRIRSFISLETY
jgi:hypothetical protein